MDDDVGIWAVRLKCAWTEGLNAFRSGALGTFELRNGRRVDTTLETIVRRKKDLAELDAMMIRHCEDERLKDALQRDLKDRRGAPKAG